MTKFKIGLLLNCSPKSHINYTFTIKHWYMKIPVLLHSHQHNVLSNFLTGIVCSLNLYFSIVKEVEHVFMCLTPIFFSCSLLHHFIYFCHFLFFFLLIYSSSLYIKEIRLWLWYELHTFFWNLEFLCFYGKFF